MTELRPESRALLRAAREGLEAGDVERSRVDRALSARLGVTVGVLAATALSPSASAASSAATAGVGGSSGAAGVAKAGIGVGAKWLAAALFVGAVGAGGMSLMHARPAVSRHAAVTVPSNAVATGSAKPASAGIADSFSEPTIPTPSALPLATAVERVMPRSTSAHPSASPGAPIAATVAAEARLLRSADEALRSGDAQRALVLLQEHTRTYPHSVLAEERSSELVSTLCALGRVDEASAEAARFLRGNPRSPLAASVRSSCAGL